MSKITVIQGQSFFDLAIQSNGTIGAVVQLALENGFSVTDELPAGLKLETVEYDGTKVELAEYYRRKGLVPATELNDEVESILENEDPCNLCKCFL